MKSRIQKISHPEFINSDLRFLHDIMIKNGYPSHLIKRLIFSTATITQSNNPNTDTPTAPDDGQNGELDQEINYRSLIYIPTVTDRIKNLFKNINVKIAFTSAITTNRFFSKLKSPLPLEQQNHIVYAVKCTSCDRYYVGQSLQRWRERSVQHRSDSRVNPKKCALANHIHQNDHVVDFKNVKVIYTELNKSKRIFLENIAIKKQNNNLNTKEDSAKFSPIYNNLLKYIKNKLSSYP